MKIICKVCGQIFNYPIEQIRHRHPDIEMDLVPPNFWDIENYESDFEIKFSDDGNVIPPKRGERSKLVAGNTPMIQYRKGVYLKDESVNPTGSFKDRGMENIMNEILMHNKKKVAVVSCGSGAISTIKYAKKYGIKSLAFIHRGIPKSSLDYISDADEIFYSDTFIHSYEDFMKYSLEHQEEVFWGFLNTNISYMLGLRTMAYEIVRDLNKVPDVILIPCGSGMNIVSQNLAFREMFSAGVISKIPKIGVVELEGGNPIERGYNLGIDEWLYVINEPVDSKTILSNDTCFNYKKIYNMVSRGEAFFISVSDAQIESFVKEHPDYNSYDFTSLSVMAALEKYLVNISNETVVAVLTCRNRDGGNIYGQ